MRLLSRFLAAFGLVIGPLVPLPVSADQDTFEVSLAGNRLGRMTHAVSGETRDVTLLLDSTPLGVFDGSYAGRTVTSGALSRHSGRTRSTRKSRDVSMRIEAGRLREVTLTPEAEQTAFTAPAAVSGIVSDPVSAFGQLMETSACPDDVRIYDGRRVALLSLEGQSRDGTRVTCQSSYVVTEGPGYLEPLGISRLSVDLLYETAADVWQLEKIGARSGPFRLNLVR